MTVYKGLYIAAWIDLLVSLFCGGVTVVGADKLGLGPVAASWIALTGLISGGVQAFLPALQRTPSAKDNAGPVDSPDPMPRNV